MPRLERNDCAAMCSIDIAHRLWVQRSNITCVACCVYSRYCSLAVRQYGQYSSVPRVRPTIVFRVEIDELMWGIMAYYITREAHEMESWKNVEHVPRISIALVVHPIFRQGYKTIPCIALHSQEVQPWPPSMLGDKDLSTLHIVDHKKCNWPPSIKAHVKNTFTLFRATIALTPYRGQVCTAFYYSWSEPSSVQIVNGALHFQHYVCIYRWSANTVAPDIANWKGITQGSVSWAKSLEKMN